METTKGKDGKSRPTRKKINDTVLADIAGTSLDTDAERAALAKLSVKKQRALAKRAKAGETVTAIKPAKSNDGTSNQAATAEQRAGDGKPSTSAVEQAANPPAEASGEARTTYYAPSMKMTRRRRRTLRIAPSLQTNRRQATRRQLRRETAPPSHAHRKPSNRPGRSIR